MELGATNEKTTVKCIDFINQNSIDYMVIGTVMENS